MNSRGITAKEHLTEISAKTFGGFFEVLKDECELDRLVILAPHGGNIEPGTSEIAQAMYYDLFNKSRHVTLWMLNGYSPGGGAFERFHIPSDEFESEDFPKLGCILGRNYAQSIAFHGCKDDTVYVGGTADNGFKSEVAEAIFGAIHGNIALEVVSNGPYAGTSTNNIVNRLSSSSIQIELPRRIRDGIGSLEIACSLSSLFASRP